MKQYMLEIKNKEGNYEPVAIGTFKEIIPIAYGNVSRFTCLGSDKEFENAKGIK